MMFIVLFNDGTWMRCDAIQEPLMEPHILWVNVDGKWTPYKSASVRRIFVNREAVKAFMMKELEKTLAKYMQTHVGYGSVNNG